MKMEKIIGENGRNNEFKRSFSKQIILGLLAHFSSLAPSMSLGFSAVTLPTLTSAVNDPYRFTSEQASWFASVASLATPFGCLFSGPISDRFGRRRAIFIVNIIGFIGWLIIAAAFYCDQHRYLILLIGRTLTGLSTGLSSMAATVYIAEISSPKLRGVLCAWSSVAFAMGVSIVYYLGFLFKDSWGVIALIVATFPCVGMAFVRFSIPESPSWLIAKGQYDLARINICKIFGAKDYLPEIEKEYESLLGNQDIRHEDKPKRTLNEQFLSKVQHLMKPNCLKPLSVILIFFFFQQFSGTFVVIFYAIDIVKLSEITLDPYLTIVIIGVVRLLAAIFVSVACRYYGRRPLSLISGIGMSVCMFLLGYLILGRKFNHFTQEFYEQISILPLMILLIYFVVSTIGFLALPFAMTAEMFPRKIRGTASGLVTCLAYFFNFITVKMYPEMVNGLGNFGVFFFYSGVSLAGTIFVLFFLPETKGKTLDQIQEYFQGKRGRTSPSGGVKL